VRQAPPEDDPGFRRGEYHPQGSTEWAAGAALMYQAAAAKAWEEGDRESATRTKPRRGATRLHRADFPQIPGRAVRPVCDGPVDSHRAREADGRLVQARDGSTDSAWVLFPDLKFNPFQTGSDDLAAILDQIPSLPAEKAWSTLDQAVAHPTYIERGQTHFPAITFCIMEPGCS